MTKEEYCRIYKPEDNANNCCWLCKKNIDGCSWAADFEPVAGWKANKIEKTRPYEQTTYKIFYCPEFEEGDSAKGREYDDERCFGLLEAIYRNAGNDYKNAYKRKLKLERRNSSLDRYEINVAENMMKECSFLLGKWTGKLKEIVEQELAEEGGADGEEEG